jgi:nucleotide-binding universal stress UspA family protein
MPRCPPSSTEPWRNVLVPLDGSEESASILEYARNILARESLAVTFLRVIECPESRARDHAYVTDSRHWKDRQLLTAARDAFGEFSGTANAELRFGDPAAEILREIVDGAHDVAVLNWHGNSWQGRPISESVAYRVRRSSPVPILYFPAPAGEGAIAAPLRFERVLVMLDGSPEAEEILPGAERMARTLGSDLHLFQAVAPGKDESTRRRTAEQYLAELARRLRSRGIVSQPRIRSGPVLEVVASLLREGGIDALAMATHARSGLAHTFYGSLTEELLRGAHRPILTLCMADHRRPIPISGKRQPQRLQ